MRCRKARWFLSARCDGTLSERQRARLDAHLLTCAECRREGFYFSEIGVLAGRMESVAVRPDFDLRLRAAIRRVEAGEVDATGRWRFASALVRPAFALVTASVVIAGGVSAYLFLSPKAIPIAQTSNQPTEVASDPTVLPATLTPVEGMTPEMRRLQERYLATGQLPEHYVVEAVSLDDPTSKKPSLRYVLPTVSTEQVSRKDSY